MAKTYSVTIAGKEYDLRYTRKERRFAERQTKMDLRSALYSQTEDVMDALVWAGIDDDSITIDEFQKLMDAHEEDQGAEGVIKVWNVARRAILESGMVGKWDPKVIDRLCPPDKEPETVTPQ